MSFEIGSLTETQCLYPASPSPRSHLALPSFSLNLIFQSKNNPLNLLVMVCVCVCVTNTTKRKKVVRSFMLTEKCVALSPGIYFFNGPCVAQVALEFIDSLTFLPQPS